MAKIGLYVYRLSLRRTGNYQEVPFATTGIGATFTQFLERFVQAKRQPQHNTETERSWVLAPAENLGHARHGLVEYGTFGIASTIRDPQTREVKLTRTSNDVEEIPLYYQFWIPPNGNYGFAALQSYRDRSCVSQVLTPLSKEFNDFDNGLRLNVQKVMPTDQTAYANRTVQKLILVKRRMSRDRADMLRDLRPEEYKVEVSLTPKRRGGMGVFDQVAPLIRGAADGAAIVLDGIEFEEASALVKVGGTYKKVGIIGPGNNAGVIDISDDVVLEPNGHPNFESVSQSATATITDFRRAYGMN